MKNQKGITLVALIITIVVMLILVAVSVAVVINSNIIGTASKASEKYEQKANEEKNYGEGKIVNGEHSLKFYENQAKLSE